MYALLSFAAAVFCGGAVAVSWRVKTRRTRSTGMAVDVMAIIHGFPKKG